MDQAGAMEYEEAGSAQHLLALMSNDCREAAPSCTEA